MFTWAPDEPLEFHPVDMVTDEDVAEVVATVRAEVRRLLEGGGVLDGDDASFTFDDLSDDSPSLAGIYAASVQGRVAMGERAGRRVFRIGAEDDAPWVTSSAPLQAHLEGFDLHAAVAVRAEDRSRLERLCRYVLRPPVAEERVELRDDGRVLLELKRPFRDGTTHLFFEPLEFLEKIAAAIPRPRVNQLIYAGILGPNAKMRRAVTAYGRGSESSCGCSEAVGGTTADGKSDTEPPKVRRRSYTFAELMARAFLIDVLDCPRCHGRMRVISTIEDPKVVRRILEHLGLPTEIPSPAPARSRHLGADGVVYDLDGW